VWPPCGGAEVAFYDFALSEANVLATYGAEAVGLAALHAMLSMANFVLHGKPRISLHVQ
jgi:hypothetical protein